MAIFSGLSLFYLFYFSLVFDIPPKRAVERILFPHFENSSRHDKILLPVT